MTRKSQGLKRVNVMLDKATIDRAIGISRRAMGTANLSAGLRIALTAFGEGIPIEAAAHTLHKTKPR